MQFRSLAAGGGWGDGGAKRWQQRCRSSSSSSAASSSSNGRGSYFDRVKGWNGPLKAALTSGSLSAAGDLLAQFAASRIDQQAGVTGRAYDPTRTARMFGFGACFYGPYQYYWYNLLEWLMPIKTSATFLAKVTANQLLLAPVTLSAVFSWNLALSGKSEQISSKIQNDLLPTMYNGWKFWIPAASLNFYAIPVEQQVLYMSACGVLWTAYLSYASVTQISEQPAAAVVPKKACCGGGKH